MTFEEFRKDLYAYWENDIRSLARLCFQEGKADADAELKATKLRAEYLEKIAFEGAIEPLKLRQFFYWAMEQTFDGLDIEGSEAQGKAVELGLAHWAPYDPDTHSFSPEDTDADVLILDV